MSGVPGYRDNPTDDWDPREPINYYEAEDFLRQYHAETRRAGDLGARLHAVRAEIAATGTYAHTPAELQFGARVAWRNAGRCIGRLYWKGLVVRDRRSSYTAEAIFADVVEHLRLAGGTREDVAGAPAEVGETAGETAGETVDRSAGSEGGRGRMRPVITIFPPAVPGHAYVRIWNEQLIRYAGYRGEDGSVTGDPRYADFTAAMIERGWSGKQEAFDVLPLAIETPSDGVRLFELPESVIVEVALTHPDYGWFAELDLRWHAVPAIANMRLTIGGVQYPCAPFNGWYMGAEIGARNLADTDRYDMLPVVAARLGLDTSRESSLWRDRALVELNIAVLHSFERAGIRVADHHTESRRFLTHLEREARAGRETPADWSWIVPPISGGVTPVFHRYYSEADQRPGFYLDQEAMRLGRVGRLPEHEPAAPPPDEFGAGGDAAVDPPHDDRTTERIPIVPNASSGAGRGEPAPASTAPTAETHAAEAAHSDGAQADAAKGDARHGNPVPAAVCPVTHMVVPMQRQPHGGATHPRTNRRPY